MIRFTETNLTSLRTQYRAKYDVARADLDAVVEELEAVDMEIAELSPGGWQRAMVLSNGLPSTAAENLAFIRLEAARARRRVLRRSRRRLTQEI